MIIYAHRGNLNGPNPERENDPKYIQEALAAGYGVEVDVWKVGEQLWLGHDEPTYCIEREFLIDKRILVHCKNAKAFDYLSQFSNIQCFSQSNEDYVLTSWENRVYHSRIQKEFERDEISVSLGYPIDKNYSYERYRKAYGVITDQAACCFKIDNTKPFELLILDVDGVLTDGTKNYNREHDCETKRFNDRDFTAIKRFRSDGVKVCFLSGDEFNRGMADKRQIHFFNAKQYSDQLDKSKALPEIKRFYGLAEECKVLYVGDDYYDLSLLNVVDLAYCPANAIQIVKNSAITLRSKGGEGVVAELYEIFKHQLPNRFPYE